MPTRKALETLVGGLSKPSKMPCFSWSISASLCNVGGKLAKVVGSVCHKCYARKGRYVFPNVQNALRRRLDAWQANTAQWEDAMVALLAGETHFRWFDSGDLQGEPMLASIVRVAERTPSTRHWLPTKEAYLVNRWLDAHGAFPANLVVRLSVPMVNVAPLGKRFPMAAVSTDPAKVTCPSSQQGNKCGDCRLCWTANHVVYAAH